ncbi:ankyrin repeat domain-containing protein [Streptomyces longispororuber]|uniref:ankyrin repeat domain-containing protein n=1 Tax=Streptomyces longispororuber TaxID=68230 RepID=UPI00210D6672|nr:ankyrin repeat domain-containing protein [Streptomyces longispororuber]MCQ4214231.1 HEAT repeat domain-containing protein [Streptomyces longispororuber]
MDDELKAGVSGLFDAVHSGDEDAVVRVLRTGVPGDVCGEDGQSALYVAAVGDEPAIVRLLLAAGADPDRLSGGTDLPLCGAACGGHAEVVRALLGAGARVDAVEEFGFRALTWAVQRGHERTVRALLDGGADARLAGAGGELPLVAAARRGSTGCVRALLEHGAPGRAEALAEARRWLGVDMAEWLRAGLVESAVGGADREAVTQRFPEEGGVTVVVELLDEAGRPTSGNDQQTGHAAIATLLEAELGILTSPGELADRAVRRGDPDDDDWVEAMAVLRRRGDDATFRAAVAWCVDRDPLRRAFAADVLGQLGLPGPDGSYPFARRAFPSLRRMARGAEAGSGAVVTGDGVGPATRLGASARPAPDSAPGLASAVPAWLELRSVIGALGQANDPAAVPEVVRFAGHPQPEVRRAVALALHGLAGGKGAEGGRTGSAGRAGEGTRGSRDGDGDTVTVTTATATATAVNALLTLTRDTDPDVRTWAAAALAGAGADTPQIRAALAALLGDPRDDVAAEAARGLAVRQDPRAVDALARLLACAQPGDYARDVALDGARALTDVRVRNRLEWTFPRGS